MRGKVLAFDTAIHRTGWCFMDEEKFVEWGSINSVGDKTSMRISQTLSSAEKLLSLYNPTHLVLEDVFMRFDVSVTKKLSRLQGALESAWIKHSGLSAIRLWTSTARSLVGVNAKAEKAQVMLWVDCTKPFVGNPLRVKVLQDLDNIRNERVSKAFKPMTIKSHAKKISDYITKETGVTEDMSDAYLLAKAFYKIEESKLEQYKD